MTIGGASSRLLRPNKRLQSPGWWRGRDHRKHQPEDAVVYKTQVVRAGSGNDEPSGTMTSKLRPWAGLTRSQEEANHIAGCSSESSIEDDSDIPVLHYLINEER
jgi:hypothetical protein